MREAPEQLIYDSVHRGNILPLTSVCNVSCIFCSHRQNPPGIKIYKMDHRTPEQVKSCLEFISPGAPVVIGESVTRIIEGEPFLHPEIKGILYAIREKLYRRWPLTVMVMTWPETAI